MAQADVEAADEEAVTLEDLRELVDAFDATILHCLVARARVVQRIDKRRGGKKRDRKREEEILTRLIDMRDRSQEPEDDIVDVVGIWRGFILPADE